MLIQGSRINAYIPAVGERVMGTICGSYKNPKTGIRQLLMITDKKSKDFEDLPQIGLRHSTLFVDTENNEVSELDRLQGATWAGAPIQVGVYAVEDFEYDQVIFPMGTVGRVIKFSGDHHINVMWYLAGVPNNPIDKKYPYLRPWEVPTKYVGFGLVELREGRVTYAWEGGAIVPAPSKPKFQAGDMVAYVSSRPFRVSGKDDRAYSIVRGTVLTVTHVDRSNITANIVGNCQGKLLGATIRTDASSFAMFPFAWIAEGKRVKVIQELMFRKRSLQDEIGIVLSSTDQDGDVGVQFQEDIGAGSLDGLGTDGKCLFVPSKALEISE